LKFLITCGSPQIPIDRVRTIGNIFKGNTGFEIAMSISSYKDHEVDLLTSNPFHKQYGKINPFNKFNISSYKTFDDLKNSMQLFTQSDIDVIIHSAAVNDYKLEGTYHRIHNGTLIRLPDAGKIKSNHKELFLRMIQTEKLIDLIRPEWGFKGILVKFKLEVGKSNEDLIDIAQKSREHSQADIIVANCLEWMNERAIIITAHATIEVERKELPSMLYGEILRLTK